LKAERITRMADEHWGTPRPSRGVRWGGGILKHYRPHIFVVVALAIVLSSGLHGALRNALTDLRFAWETRQASGDIVVVAIDAPSIEKIGVWPWPRQLHAHLLRQLEIAGVRDVVFDVDFSAPSDETADRAFVEALERAGGSVVLPSFKQPGAGGSNGRTIHINRPLKQFANHSWSAVVNVTVEPDGLVRCYPFGETFDGQFLPSMGAVLAGQYAEKRAPFLIDFSIRAASIPRVSYVDVLRGDEATLEKLRDKKVIIGGTALELGDRLSIPNGGVVSGPLLQTFAAESILQNRTLRFTSDVVTAAGLCMIALIMMLFWRRLAAGMRVIILVGMAAAIEISAFLLQAKLPLILDTSLFHTAIAVYMAAIALDEIDFRDLLSRVAESRFQRIAMSLGDGLVCTDQNHRITVWNPGAAAIFGYDPAEMLGRPFDMICAGREDVAAAISILVSEAARARSQLSGGLVMEFDGAPQERRGVSSRGMFLRLARHRWLSVWCDPARYIGAKARSRKNSIPGGTRSAHWARQPQQPSPWPDGNDCHGGRAAGRSRAAGGRPRRLPADQRHAGPCLR
jgi:CHASE2 domain-containing sensor protein